MGGHIAFESERGVGTTFYFELPTVMTTAVESDRTEGREMVR
jgi:signal transduction histidine kinase